MSSIEIQSIRWSVVTFYGVNIYEYEIAIIYGWKSVSFYLKQQQQQQFTHSFMALWNINRIMILYFR